MIKGREVVIGEFIGGKSRRRIQRVTPLDERNVEAMRRAGYEMKYVGRMPLLDGIVEIHVGVPFLERRIEVS